MANLFEKINMGKSRLIIFSVLSIVLVFMLLLGSTYSLFSASNIDEDVNVYQTGNLNVTYTIDSTDVVFDSTTPMSVEDASSITPYRLTVNNSGNVPYMFDLILNDTTATDKIDTQYIMVQVGMLDPVRLITCTNNIIKEDIIVPANDSVIIDIRIWLAEDVSNSEFGKSFYADLSIDGLAIYDDSDEIDNSILMLPGSETFSYTGDSQSYIVPMSGYYKLEAWGAQGGHYDDTHSGGKGAYTSGEIYLEKGTEIYIYVGGQGPMTMTSSMTNVGGYNGGGYSGYHDSFYSYGGGGATDFRLVSGTWNEFNSLKSRIMVAAGGGGTVYLDVEYVVKGGYGGALIGGDAVGNYTGVAAPTGATQTSTGTGLDSAYLGFFGYGVQSNTSGWGGGAGGGYYAGVNGHGYGGSGGSSFVSGHIGCNAISESSTSSSITHLGTAEHYSGYVFVNSSMIAGNESMPSYNSSSMQVGNSGNGYARITYVSNRKDIETQYAYTGNYQVYEVKNSGYYKIETWGAQGGASALEGGTTDTSAYSYCEDTVSGYCDGGHGAYASGEVYLNKGTDLYVYVGGKGEDGVASAAVSGGYNGGGNADYDQADNESDGGGGGATDVRLLSGSWNNFSSLKSRIITAAGGGGGSDQFSGLPGGTLASINTNILGYVRSDITLASQTSGYQFGIGQNGVLVRNNYPLSGAGGGYYGGYSIDNGSGYYNIATGGSSFVSGYLGAVAAGNPEKYSLVYTGSSMSIYDRYDNQIDSITVNSPAVNIERTVNYIGKSTLLGDSGITSFAGEIYKFKLILADGTVVLNYDFTKNTVEDLSGNGYNGTLMNGASLVNIGKGYALSLDGVDDYLKVPTLPSSINFAGGFTVEFEVIWSKLGSYSSVFDFSTGAWSNNINFSNYSNTKRLAFYIYNGTTMNDLYSSNEVISLNGTKHGINNSVCETGTTDITCSYHYSDKKFENAVMKSGNDSQPTHDGESTQTGNIGNGYAKISYIRSK